jgi:hypothetical protein
VVPGSVPPGADLIERGGRPVGFEDDRRWVFPCASADGQDDPAWLQRLYLEAVRRWHLPGAGPADEAGRVFRSDTGQLVLKPEPGLFTASAPRVRIAMGFLGGTGPVELGGVTVDCDTPFASVSLISLDGAQVERSRHLLLTAVSRPENTGQAYLDDHSAIPETGRAPVRVEPVSAEVSIRTARQLRAFALDSRGRRRSELTGTHDGDRLVISTAAAGSPWVLLTAR